MKVLGNYKLEFEGVTRTLSFSVNMLRAFKELHGMDLRKKSIEVDKLRAVDAEEYFFEHGMLVCDIVFCAMYAYCEEEGVEPDFTRS